MKWQCDRPKGKDDPKNGWFIGHDPDQIWDYEFGGVWQLGQEEEASKYGCKPGDFRFIDQDGNGVLDDDDKTFQGYKTPRFFWSWRNEFIYKDFSLSFMLYSDIGHYDYYNHASNSGGMFDRYSTYDQPRWTPEIRRMNTDVSVRTGLPTIIRRNVRPYG